MKTIRDDEFYGIATNDGKLSWIAGHAQKVVKFLQSNAGQYYRIIFKNAAREPKTPKQLGIYWGLYLPEIKDELVRQGFTTTVGGVFGSRKITRERPINIDEAHEIVKELCALVDTDGQYITLSAMDKFQCVSFLDNVLNFAGELGMNVELLRAEK